MKDQHSIPWETKPTLQNVRIPEIPSVIKFYAPILDRIVTIHDPRNTDHWDLAIPDPFGRKIAVIDFSVFEISIKPMLKLFLASALEEHSPLRRCSTTGLS